MWAAEEGWEEKSVCVGCGLRQEQCRSVGVPWDGQPRKGGCGILCPLGEAKDVNQTGLC